MNTSIIIQHLENIISSNKNIGVLCSGGLDSGVLIFLLLKLSKEKNTDNRIKIFTVPRIDDSLVHSTAIVFYLQEKFNIQLEHVAVGNIKFPDASRQIISGIFEALGDRSLNMVLAADTKVPDFELITGQQNPERVRGKMLNYDQPFFDYTKDYTVKLGIDNGADEIFQISHSCVTLTKGKCNTCWWCKEREWAFFKNNYTDPGTKRLNGKTLTAPAGSFS